jgi:DNA-binding NarL/FixJ family response regulator
MPDRRKKSQATPSRKKKLRVSLVDDVEQVANDVRELLRPSSEFIFAQWYSSGPEAIQAIDRADGLPDLMLMDLHLDAKMNGVQCIAALKRRHPRLKVVAYTVFEDAESILAAIQSGAAGYLLKDTPPDLLLAELKVMHLGGAPLTPAVAQTIIEYAFQKNLSPVAPVTRNSRPDRSQTDAKEQGRLRKLLRRSGDAQYSQSALASRTDLPPPSVQLSERETEILNCISVGMNYRRIAEALEISGHTVRRHIENIYEKLSVHSRLEAVRAGRRIGLIKHD